MSLNEMLGDDSQEDVLSILGSADSVEGEYMKKVISEVVGKCVEALPDREEFVVASIYGLNGMEKLEGKEVAEKLEITESRVSELKTQALGRLRRNAKMRELSDLR